MGNNNHSNLIADSKNFDKRNTPGVRQRAGGAAAGSAVIALIRLASFWSFLDPPGTSKNYLPSRRESNFHFFQDRILSTLSEPILDPKTLPKSSPRGFKIRSKTKWRMHATWMPILIATWHQLGPKMGSKIGPRCIKKRCQKNNYVIVKNQKFRWGQSVVKMAPHGVKPRLLSWS